MSVLEGMRWYYRTFGPSGVWAASAHRVFGRPTLIAAHPATYKRPLYLRLATTDELVYREILLGGQYDFPLPFVPEIIVDAGANIGMASIYLARRYPEARIIAVEPEPGNFDLLVRNTVSYPKILPVHAALWNRDGEIRIGDPEADFGPKGEWAFVTRETGAGVKVRAVTMRTLMKETQICSIDLLKIDIEGAEKEVFETCDWTDEIRGIMIELHDRFRPGCSQVVNAALRGFSQISRHETTFYIRPAFSQPLAQSKIGPGREHPRA